jgi:hypothetical protein
MISKMTPCFLICFTILYGSFTLSYNLVLIGDQNGIMKVLATSDDDSGESAGNSDDTNPDDTNPDDTNPDDTNLPSSEDASDDPGIDCNEGMVLIDGECREAPSPSAIAASKGKAGAASSPGVLSAPPSDIMGNIGTADVGTPQNEYSSPGNDKFHLNSEDIALELSSLTPLQIAEYPITDLSDNDLMLALSFLAPADLGKVLKNIPVNDLVVVKERLGESKFNEFLSKVSISDREVLENILAI